MRDYKQWLKALDAQQKDSVSRQCVFLRTMLPTLKEDDLRVIEVSLSNAFLEGASFIIKEQ